MRKLLNLTLRNIKVYFSDKSMFFTSLITPLILLVLYATFLAGVFKDSLGSAIPKGIGLSDKIVNSIVSGQILSSLLAVSCITVAFTSNLLMVNDKTNGSLKDLDVSPISNKTKSLSYFLASFISTIIVNIVALILCLIYTYSKAWYYNFSDIIYLFGDVILLTLFGCALSSVINFLLKSQGQASAVGTIVSAGYGFICGAYMPISSFGKTLQKVLSFLPGTYGTSLIKNHAMNPSFIELSKSGVPSKIVDEIKQTLDCGIKFFDKDVSIYSMYSILIVTIVVLISIFIFENKFKKKD